ncbi:hypothetical protein E3Q06_01492 [Wallemia mellicola]|nr:hypothetical protein E3Q24_00936 [Wallemia mellicola]TIB86696.1 hypothetical protein E3Q21_01622 [Wallemia mellicola]TIB89662.1 hypothetical protein E3Q20_01578 [Wallemia mellicola]TIC24759.1 hypothetical protein E3Q12_01309 [Wallemia mellicola]TIC36595.1 hypothetical protein E3Q09_01255 [Wallemia mellicola]
MSQLKISDQIIASLFSGLSTEKYLSHCKIIESSDPPKPRYLLLAIDRTTKQANIYKSKRNSNGTFSIGKTWPLSSLRAAELLTHNTFKLTLSKSYTWKAERVHELHPFLDALIDIYNGTTGQHIALISHNTAPLKFKPSSQQLRQQEQPEQPREAAKIPQIPPQAPPAQPPPQPSRQTETLYEPVQELQQPVEQPVVSIEQKAPQQPVRHPQVVDHIPQQPQQLANDIPKPKRDNPPARPTKQPAPEPPSVPTITPVPTISPVPSQSSPQPSPQPTPPQTDPPRLSVDTQTTQHSQSNHRLTPKQSFENSTSPIIQKRSHRRKISRPSDASLGDAFTSLARKPSNVSAPDSFNDIQHIDEALGGANWRSLRSVAQVDSHTIDQEDESKLANEINNVEAAMIRSIVSDQDDSLDYLFNYLDTNLGELDDMDALVGKFRAHLMLVGEDIAYVESQRGKQAQSNNQQALINEMEKLEELSSAVNVDQADLIVLTKESLESDKGIAALERAAATLYKAIKANDEQYDEKRVNEYKTIMLQFAKRMLDYLSIMFRFQVDNLLNDPSRQISERKPKIRSHEKMETYLGRYCGLVLFLREMDQARYREVCANYFSSSSELHSKEMNKLLAVYANLTRKATEEESDANFSNPIDSANQGARKRNDKRLDAKRSKQGDSMPAHESLAKVLNQVSTQMKGEEIFLQDLLAILSTPPTFAEYVDLEDVYKRKAREALAGIDFGPLSDLKNAFELIFAFFAPSLQSWIDGALVKDNMQIVGMIAQLERAMKDAYGKSQPYLHSLLKKQKSRLNNMFSKYISDQIKAIENTKLTTKKRKGVAPFIRIIPSFVGRIEQQLYNIGDDWEIRINVNDAYDKIIGRMFDSLKHIAREEDMQDVASEDKGALNLHVIMIANTHHFLQSFKAKPMKPLTPFMVTAEGLYSSHMEGYIKLLWRRHLAKQIDYFDGLEKALKGTKATEMVSHPLYGKSVYKRVVRDFSSKDLKKATEALHKRVEKHFDVNVEDEGSYHEVVKVIDAVWKALEEDITTITKNWNELIQICFPNLEGLHYTQTDIRVSKMAAEVARNIELPNIHNNTTGAKEVPEKGYKLTSNGGPIDDKNVAFLKETAKDAPIDVIRERYENDGYVLVKGLLPIEVVRKMRRDYFEFVKCTGILKEGTDSVDGIFTGGPPNKFGGPGSANTGEGTLDPQQVEFLKRATEAHYSEFYDEFQKTPELYEFARKITGWQNILLLQRQMLRTNVKGSEATAVHYDQIFLRGALPTSLTAWIPIGGCNVEGGSLIYLEKSHEIGREIENDFSERAKDFTPEERLSAFNSNMMRGGILSDDAQGFGKVYGRRWLVTNYEDGDVIFHQPYMIHASSVNETDKIRLSTDLRFVNPDEDFDRRWTNKWYVGDGL